MAHCSCPSVSEGRVRMTTHLAGCRFLEDLVEGSCCDDAVEERELSEAERALAASYERYADELAAIEALRSGRAAV